MGGTSKERLLGATRSVHHDDADDLAVALQPPRDVGKSHGVIDRRAESAAETIRDEAAALETVFSLVGTNVAGRPLPPALLARLTAELNVDLTRVRIHTDDRAARACAAIGAQAFTTGEDIYFASGAYDPTSPAGVELIAHEAAHIAQRHRSTGSDASRISRPGDHHEQEADAFARSFARDTTKDPASLVNRTRREGQRMALPFLPELEQQLGMSLDFVEAYTGDAARLACELMSASAFAVRSVIAFADPSPQREVLLHELAHVVQMGGRGAKAPDQFRTGSLSIGNSNDATEYDARRVAGGASVATTSSPDVVRRADTPPADSKPKKEWKLEDAKKRFEQFAGVVEKKPEKADAVFCKTGDDTVRFGTTSAEPFRLAKYKEKVTHLDGNSDLTDDDLDRDLTELNKGVGKDLGLAKVGENGKRWAWIKPDEYSGGTVEYLLETKYKHKSNLELYELYCNALAALTKLQSKSTLSVPLASVKNDAVATFSKVENGTALTDKELKACRDALEKAIVAEENYKIKDGEWKVYFDDVVKAPVKFPQAMVGDWFGKIASRDMNDASLATDPTQIVFTGPGLPNDVNHRGDGLLIEGSVLKVMEFKTGPSTPGTDDDPKSNKFLKQALGYAMIVSNPQIKGTKVKQTQQIGPFTQCIYVFATQVMAQKWGPKLKAVFQTQPDAENKLVVYPDAGDGIATLKFNPTFEVPLKDAKATSHHLKNPPVIHPGVLFKQIDLTTKGAGSSEVTGGEVIFDIDLQGGAKAENVKKPIQPGEAGGTVENQKFKGLQSALDKVFKGRVEADAKLTDDGVAATLKVTEGPSGIPNLLLKESSVTVTYANGAMTVEGAIELSNGKGNLHGKATVTWDGKDFGFKGEATLEEGMIDGLGRTTGTVEYIGGKWKFGIPEASYTKSFKAVTLTGKAFGLEFDTKTGGFSGLLEIDADLGMFGKASASAELKDNKLHKAQFDYDSPEFTYPAKSDKPAFKGTVGGTIKYNEGKFSGDFRGTANIALPALQKIAGEKGIGLAVDGHIDEAGAFSGTIKSTNPLKFGKYLEIPSISCTIGKDGAVTGDFAIKVVNLKYLEKAEVACSVTKDGITVKHADLSVTFGDKAKGSFWGTLSAKYSDEQGLEIGGTVNYKIKEDMIAVGTLKYDQKTNAVSLDMKVEEITLLDKTVSKTLFKASKQIPVVNIYGLGIYVDIGFDLGFDFGFKLTMTPEVDFVGLSLDTWKFEKIAAKLKIGGDIFAQLTGTPKLGIGVFALDPSIIRGGGGLKVPIVGRLDIKPSGDFGVSYKPDGGVDGTAKLGLAGQFGITGSLKPYAEFSVLNDMWNPTWEGEALASFEILKPKELFNFTVDFAGDNKDLKDGPKLPEENQAQAPREPTGDKTAKADPAAPTDKGGDANKGQAPKSGEVTEGGDQGPFSLESLLAKFQSNQTVATAGKIFGWAQKVWKVVKPFYDIIEPIVKLIGQRIEAIIDLFETEAPTADNIVPWLWQLAKKLWNVAFGGLSDVANAIRTIAGAAIKFAKKLINKAVQEGHIGVKRYSYYIWMPWPKDDIQFMAAAEYKVVIPGVVSLGPDGPPGFLLRPSGAISLVLYEALTDLGIGYSYVGNSDINEPYNDIWYGAGARG